MEEWSLQAVVRGSGDDEFCFGESAAPMASGSGGFGPLDLQSTGLFDDHDKAFLFSSFPDLFGDHHHQAGATVFLGKDMDSELEELYKPFYPVYNVGTQVHDCSVEAQAQYPSFPDAVAAAADHQVIKQEVVGVVEEKKIVFCASSPSSNSHATKPKKRKNQQKRVVVQVSAEGLSSDLWAWRKYGQKPIKGSPYPRSYYRCSSSKGCLARRQVEQSCTDPGTYIVTYSAEHNHPQPTRRNSLAGVNRHKFRSTPKSPTNSDGPVTAAKSNKEAPSPTTSPSFSSADEEVLQGKIKQEMGFGEDDHREMMAVAGECDDNDLELPDMAFSDDFFVGLEDLDGLNSGNMSFYNCSNKQYQPLPFCS